MHLVFNFKVTSIIDQPYNVVMKGISFQLYLSNDNNIVFVEIENENF